MTDDFLVNLRNDWRSQDSEFEAVKHRLARARWTTRALIAFEAARLLFAIAVGVWFAAIAWQRDDIFFGLSAFTLLLAVPPLTIAVLMARREMLDDSSETPEGVLRFGLRRASATDRILKLGLWGAAMLQAFVAVLWIFKWAGLIHRHYPLIPFTCIWIGSALIALAWYVWRKRRNDAERAQCRRLLAQFEAS
jgi:hypothetical protein